jgi:hypothetical protein
MNGASTGPIDPKAGTSVRRSGLRLPKSQQVGNLHYEPRINIRGAR